ncbi:hypothetical protein [Hymenobacter terrenus]|uniref:hypothetical protein n=1 Tax=Hymenobacter terrenus TaxID=1629124 RepID=UPI000619DDDA|nr:hypothetical protein [Hymenobacter terrenus]
MTSYTNLTESTHLTVRLVTPAGTDDVCIQFGDKDYLLSPAGSAVVRLLLNRQVPAYTIITSLLESALDCGL